MPRKNQHYQTHQTLKKNQRSLSPKAQLALELATLKLEQQRIALQELKKARQRASILATQENRQQQDFNKTRHQAERSLIEAAMVATKEMEQTPEGRAIIADCYKDLTQQ